MIKIKKFHLSHLNGFVLHVEDAVEATDMMPGYSLEEAFVLCIAESQKVWSVFYNNKLAGFFGYGIVPGQPEGTCNVWFLRDVYCKKIPKIAFVKYYKQLLKLLPKQYKACGVFKPLKESYDAQFKWLNAIGFDFVRDVHKTEHGEYVYFYRDLTNVR